jgi:hypothetical protein
MRISWNSGFDQVEYFDEFFKSGSCDIDSLGFEPCQVVNVLMEYRRFCRSSVPTSDEAIAYFLHVELMKKRMNCLLVHSLCVESGRGL